MAEKKGTLRIGTCGYAYESWVGPLYPKDMDPSEWLRLYARRFGTVELDATFYRTPTPSTVERWREETPRNFRFTARGAKVITHSKMLRGCAKDLTRVRMALSRLGVKLGAVLWSLPSGLRMDLPRLDTFLRVVTGAWRTRHAIEFRHATWLCDETYAMLQERRVSLVNTDTPRARVPHIATTDFVYLRRLGPGGSNQKAYSDRALREDAEHITEWLKQGINVWACFGNDADALAVRNARRLRELCLDKGQ